MKSSVTFPLFYFRSEGAMANEFCLTKINYKKLVIFI